LTLKHWPLIGGALVLAGACDYTPELPPAPATTPRPSPATGGAPVVVVPISSPAPGQTPQPFPVPAGSSFKIVLSTPPEYSTINLTDRFFAEWHRPTLDFEFQYPQNLTLDDDFTNIEIALVFVSRFDTPECLRTDLAHSIRLDREDKVYLANSVALFRTGIWRRGFGGYCGHVAPASFITDHVQFRLTPSVSYPFQIFTYLIPMQWTFDVR
jgi:hypothetical protein